MSQEESWGARRSHEKLEEIFVEPWGTPIMGTANLYPTPLPGQGDPGGQGSPGSPGNPFPGLPGPPGSPCPGSGVEYKFAVPT